MTEEPAKLVLQHLRHIRAGVDGLREDMRDVKRRLTSLEDKVAALHTAISGIHADFAGSRCASTGSSGGWIS